MLIHGQLAARLADVDGRLIAPLSGGAMNVLVHALYGPISPRQALEAAWALDPWPTLRREQSAPPAEISSDPRAG